MAAMGRYRPSPYFAKAASVARPCTFHPFAAIDAYRRAPSTVDGIRNCAPMGRLCVIGPCFGEGPQHAYPDGRSARRVGRWVVIGRIRFGCRNDSLYVLCACIRPPIGSEEDLFGVTYRYTGSSRRCVHVAIIRFAAENLRMRPEKGRRVYTRKL